MTELIKLINKSEFNWHKKIFTDQRQAFTEQNLELMQFLT